LLVILLLEIGFFLAWPDFVVSFKAFGCWDGPFSVFGLQLSAFS